MSFTVEDVKSLREKTGAGMMACKEALKACDGKIDEAVEYLRKKGIASAEKKTGRSTGDGLIEFAIAPDGLKAAMVEVNCETDFVAKTDQFRQLTTEIANWALGQDKETLAAGDLPAPLAEQMKQTIAKIGENIQFKRGMKITASSGVIEGYLHLGSKLGVLVEVAGSSSGAARELARELALQVAAANPQVVSRDRVPAEMVEKEKDIYREQVRGAGKPENVVEKIVGGKLDKFYSEICLMEQPYIKDPQKSVEAVVKEAIVKLGENITVKGFARYRLGE